MSVSLLVWIADVENGCNKMMKSGMRIVHGVMKEEAMRERDGEVNR